MNVRLLVLAAMLVPLTAQADEPSKGEQIFDEKCSQCHTFDMAQAMLKPVPEADRPGHLRTFLKTHPPKLDENEIVFVIQALSQPR